jgi:phosphate uptake regulator
MEAETGGGTKAPDKFHRELEVLKDKLLKLAGLAEKAIMLSVKAFLTGDEDLAHRVIRGDKRVNDLEETIDGECVRLIALFQPVAIDLRQLMAVDHIIAEHAIYMDRHSIAGAARTNQVVTVYVSAQESP